jgi:hypothetical protein
MSGFENLLSDDYDPYLDLFYICPLDVVGCNKVFVDFLIEIHKELLAVRDSLIMAPLDEDSDKEFINRNVYYEFSNLHIGRIEKIIEKLLLDEIRKIQIYSSFLGGPNILSLIADMKIVVGFNFNNTQRCIERYEVLKKIFKKMCNNHYDKDKYASILKKRGYRKKIPNPEDLDKLVEKMNSFNWKL